MKEHHEEDRREKLDTRNRDGRREGGREGRRGREKERI